MKGYRTIIMNLVAPVAMIAALWMNADPTEVAASAQADTEQLLDSVESLRGALRQLLTAASVLLGTLGFGNIAMRFATDTPVGKSTASDRDEDEPKGTT